MTLTLTRLKWAAGALFVAQNNISRNMKVVQYTNNQAEEWDAFVQRSKNGTFLLERRFMDYHADRFKDCSLMLYNDEELVGLFPANWDEESQMVCSHQGLTYGGLIYTTETTEHDVLEMMQSLLIWYMDYLQVKRLLYKPIPYIYSECAAEEDLYALFRAGAHLKTRSVSSVVTTSNPLKMRKLRQRGAQKAIDSGLYIEKMADEDWDTLQRFMDILTDVLLKYHQVKPVHTYEEMRLLMSRFPQQIKLFLVRSEAEIVAGCIVFRTKQVAHIQYIASSEEGRKNGALDLLFRHLINERFKQIPYIDFGISTEHGGQLLNEGLIFQKEGFGARAVCYDTYELELDRAIIQQMLPPKAEEAEQPVKFLDLKRINNSFEPRISEEVSRVVRAGRYISGPMVKTFERNFAEYIGTSHCVLCGNGLEALTLILRGYKLLRGWSDEAEVIVPANTFIASILAIKEAGLKPVLCEPCLDTYLIDVQAAAALVNERTVALLPVHLYGRIAPMNELTALAREHDLVVVEDAAQAHGAMLGDRHAGHLGDAAAFSFYPSKNLGAIGDAGCVTTDDGELAELVAQLGNYGSKEKYVFDYAGMNSRTDELQAAVLDVKLPRLDADNARRVWIAQRYLEGIDNPLVTLPQNLKDERRNVWYVFPVRSKYRKQLQEWLAAAGIETMIHYPIPPHQQRGLPEFASLKLPVTEQIHREILSLPISPLMTDRELVRVIEAINRFNPEQ